jgi:hypothetical protein
VAIPPLASKGRQAPGDDSRDDVQGRGSTSGFDKGTASSPSGPASTTHTRLRAWVDEVASLTEPDSVYWCTGSDDEWVALTDELVNAGTLVRLNPDKKPNSFWCASDPTDVARVEDRTFICSLDESDAGADQQLDGAGRDEVGHDGTVPRFHARSHHVRDPVRDGSR